MKHSLKIHPDNELATWEDVKAKRNELEVSPITLNDGRIFDFDKDAMERLERTIKGWDNIPSHLLVNGKFGWKMHNNNFSFMDKAELEALVSELEVKQLQRSALNFVFAETFLNSNPTIREVKDSSNWPMV